MSIPFIDLKTQYQALKPQIQERINTVLEHGQYIMGPEVKELEDKLAVYTGSKHCITVASGTEALLMSLMALDIKPGDEVITTPFTFVATAEVIVLLGAKPIFVDVEPDTGNIDANLIEAKITNKTKAIMPVSLYGQTADMDEINAIAVRHGNIPVIEDAAQSFGATYKGKKAVISAPLVVPVSFQVNHWVVMVMVGQFSRTMMSWHKPCEKYGCMVKVSAMFTRVWGWVVEWIPFNAQLCLQS